MARSLNRAQIIGNLTKDPELRYTPNGTAVCSFSIATNRNWTTDSGEKKEDVEFHRVVAWNKLAEICSQFLVKGRKVFVEGRLSTRSWNAQDGTSRSTTEIIISDMILLDSKRSEEEKVDSSEVPVEEAPVKEKDKASKTKPVKEKAQEEPQGAEEEISPDDIPF